MDRRDRPENQAPQDQAALLAQAQRQLSRELHDDCGQLLTLLQLRLAHLHDAVPVGQTDLASQVAGLSGLVEQLAQRLRRLCNELRSPSLLDEKLAIAQRRLAAETALLVPEVQIRLDLPPGEGDWPPAVEQTLYRIAQEALTNALRHGRPRSIDLHLQPQGDELILLVRDDGQGVDAGHIPFANGLLGMRERLSTLGGTLAIDAPPGGGTVLRASIPLIPAEQP